MNPHLIGKTTALSIVRRQASIALRGAFIVLCLGVFSLASFAEPGYEPSVITSMKSEPLSLFDWGLFTLEEELQSVKRNERDFIRTSYQPEKNRILIDGVFFVEENEIEAINARRACYTRHHAIKLTLGIIDTDRINLAPAAEFRMGLKFSHRDNESDPDQPDAEEIGEQLMQMVYIKVGIGSNPDQFPFLQDMRCDGALLSQDVNYSDGMVDQRQ